MSGTLKAFGIWRGESITFESMDYNFYEDLMAICKTTTFTEADAGKKNVTFHSDKGKV